jgi:hypothetical protein
MPLRKATQAVISPNICTTDTNQTITGTKTFSQSILGNVTGNVTGNVSGNITGNVSGNIIGNVTGNVTGNVSGSAGTLSTPRTIGISGAITGTATPFNGSSDITIPATIASGSTITSPNLAGTPTYAAGFGGISSKYIKGITDGLPATDGYIGQVITNSSALITIVSNANVFGAQILLYPGDWEVYGNATFNFSGVSAAAGDFLGASISSLNPSTTVLVENQRQVLLVPAITSCTQSPAYAFVTPRIRFNVTANSSVYIVVQAPTTSAGTMQFSSIITANRIR